MQQGEASVCVVVPVFNAGEYLKFTLDALMSQTLQQLEVIAIDDGSTDGSGDLLDQYALRFPKRLVVIHTENRGAWKARLRGIRSTNASYIGFCDSDDVPKPEMFEKLLERAQEDGADLVVCAFERL